MFYRGCDRRNSSFTGDHPAIELLKIAEPLYRVLKFRGLLAAHCGAFALNSEIFPEAGVVSNGRNTSSSSRSGSVH